MYRELFESSPLLLLPLVAMAMFMTAFVTIIVRVIANGRAAYDEAARLPLEGGGDHE
jgi:hypothetical protein